MKKHLITVITLLCISTFLFFSCTVEEVNPIDENAVASASANINGVNYTFSGNSSEIDHPLPIENDHLLLI